LKKTVSTYVVSVVVVIIIIIIVIVAFLASSSSGHMCVADLSSAAAVYSRPHVAVAYSSCRQAIPLFQFFVFQ